mgnify:FL=1
MAAPTVQAHDIIATVSGATNITFTWTNGDGARRAVFVALHDGTGSPVAPANGTQYSGDAAFMAGTRVGSTPYYCVYDGTGTTVPVTNLSPGVQYLIQICEYNGTGGTTEYLTIAAVLNPLEPWTVTAAPYLYDPTSITDHSFVLNWFRTLGATGYRLDVSSNAIFTALLIDNGDVLNVVTFLADTLTPQAVLWSRIRAYNTAGTSSNSNVVVCQIRHILPTRPHISRPSGSRPRSNYTGVGILASSIYEDVWEA